MVDDLRSRADARLDDALRGAGAADPRPVLRDALRSLRDADPDGFAEARRRFEEDLLGRVAAGEDALTEWIDYGRWLAERAGPGSAVSVSPDGRSSPWQPPYRAGELVLFLPEAARLRAVVLAAPARPTPAQQATRELLAGG
jgi:hypothetical protein